MKKIKKNNKGFSLVELIVVIAIMAVLMTVLAPQFLRYVEKSRTQKDESAAGEILNATKIALADESISKELAISGTDSVTLSYEDNDTAFTAPTADIVDAVAPAANTASLISEMNSVIGQVDFVSSVHNGKTYKVTISYDTANKSYKFVPAWS